MMIVRIFIYAMKNIWRNQFLSVFSVIIIGVLIFFINIGFIVQSISSTLIEAINSKLSFSLYLKDEYPLNHADIQILLQQIQSAIPGVHIVTKTKEEVLEEMKKKDPELIKIIETKNPFPATIRISSIGIEYYETLNSIIESKMYVLSDFRKKGAYDYRTQYQNIISIISVLRMLTTILYVIIFFFLLSIFIILYSLMSNFIHSYKNEIYIIHLVWGSKSFIYGPFIVQSLLYVLIGMALSLASFLFLFKKFAILFESEHFYESFLPFFPQFIGMQIATLGIIAIASASFSIYKYMHTL